LFASVVPALAATTTYKLAFRSGEFYDRDLNGDGDTDDGGEGETGSFTLKKGGEKVGHMNYECSVTEVSPPRDLCWASARIKGKGQVIFHGSGANNTEVFHAAITGGTGAYRSASGVALLDFRHGTLRLDID
jgi:hypothetical protein